MTKSGFICTPLVHTGDQSICHILAGLYLDKVQMTKSQELYCKLVEAYEGGDRSLEELSKQFGVSERTVRRYLDKFKRGVPVADIKGRGQPRALSSTDRVTLARMVAKFPHATTKEHSTKFEAAGKKCCPETIRNTLLSMGYKSSIPKVIPMVTDKAKETRVAWARDNIGRDWGRVVFTDETSIQLDANIVRAWHKKESRPTCPRSKYPKKAMFWGGISRDFKTDLIVIQGSISAQSYIDLLHDKYIPWIARQKKGAYVFQQDNAPAHTAKATTQFFQDQNVEVLAWPPYSPDLNPIENLWGILKRKVDLRKPSTLEELISVATSEWRSIPLSIVGNCIDSMPRRLESVITNQGNKVNY